MQYHKPFRLLSTLAVIVGMLLGSAQPLVHAQEGTIYLPSVGSSLTIEERLFRTYVDVQTSVQWRDLEVLNPVFLDRSDSWALLLVDDAQLADLARLGYNPSKTNGLIRLVYANQSRDVAAAASLQPVVQRVYSLAETINGADTVSAADTARTDMRDAVSDLTDDQEVFLALALEVDSDNDGLTDDQESWWCTDKTRADTDYDSVSDGDEVTALKEWVNNSNKNRLRVGPPVSGQPFNGWPTDNPGCLDNDRDSIPNLAELYDLGLNMAAESTDRDQFDDGQEVFGTTNCPGSGTGCGYGSLPPASNDPGVVLFPEMPGWVKAPGNHPLVAGLPVVEIDIVPSSLHVETVTTVTTDKTISEGTEKSYSTAKTEGTSASVANTQTWNEWQEIAESLEQSVPVASGGDDQQNVAQLDDNGKKVLGGLKIIGGIGTAVAGCVGALGTTAPTIIGIPAGALICGGSIAAGLGVAAEGYDDLTSSDETQTYTEMNQYQSTDVRLNNEINNNVDVILNQSFDTSGITAAIEGNRLAQIRTGQILNQRLAEMSYAITAPRFTTTNTRGRSYGGSQTTTHEEYEEHTVTNGEAFSSIESWSTATAIDSAHAADFWFSYQIANRGDDFARKICDISFSVFIGDEDAPVITYDLAPDLGSDGCLHNFRPDDIPIQRSSRRIPISLSQMAAIDTGQPIRVILSRFVLSTEDYYAEDAATRGLTISIEDGTDDGDELFETYLVPTWKPGESVLQVLGRYFPNETDADGLLTAIWTPEYRTDTPSWCREPKRPIDYPTKALWCKHDLSVADWWNVYTDGLGNGTEGFQDTTAIPGGVALFRFNKDSDHDGFSDRSEIQFGTDPSDASSYPYPEVLAGIHKKRSGNNVTATLSLLNTGFYDAYGVEAILIAPDDSVEITNNTVGGSGRVRAQKQVIVGSRLIPQSPMPAPWTDSAHASVAVGGYYTGNADRVYVFSVDCGTGGGCEVGEGSWSIDWSNGAGGSGSVDFGTGYTSPTFRDVEDGITLGIYSGSVQDGETFTVEANMPRDTFKYTIKREPYTEPLVIVSYNDPQGNHRYVVPADATDLSAPTDNLQVFAGQMLHNVGVDITTVASFTTGNNAFKALVNNPSDATLKNAHIIVETVDSSGQVVQTSDVQKILNPGPTYVDASVNTNGFSPSYSTDETYIVMVFLTDYEGNILDVTGRPLSNFQVDPKPKVAMDTASLTWNFGTAQQGTLLKHPLAIANVGQSALYMYLSPASGLSLEQSPADTVGAADLSDYVLTLRTDELAVGGYDKTVKLYTSDPDKPTLNVRIVGAITAASGDTGTSGTRRPLDVSVTVDGPKSNGEWIEYSHTRGPEPQTLHPVKVYNGEYTTELGVGKYATDFGFGTASYEMFGDGHDGDLTIGSDVTFSTPSSVLAADATAGQFLISLSDTSGMNIGDEILLIQVQGAGAGRYETNRIAAKNNNQITLLHVLQNTYTQSGSSKAQVLKVPNYRNVTITTSGHWRTPAWNGSTGGIIVLRSNGTLSVDGIIDANYTGFRGVVTPGSSYPNYDGANGEGTAGPGGTHSYLPNGSGGGGGRGDANVGGDERTRGSGGGGGGHATAGSDGVADLGTLRTPGQGGLVSGNVELSEITFGGAGGAPGYDSTENSGGQRGGNGGGIVFIAAKDVILNGSVSSGGETYGVGYGGRSGGSGGGAGGSILFRVGNISSGTNSVSAVAGDGTYGWQGANGGNGSEGRIRMEYCESLSGTTNPPASTQKLDCYIAEQIESSPYTSGRLNLPEDVTTSATYRIQYGRKIDYSAAGNQTTTIAVPAGIASNTTLDALISGVGSGDVTLRLDVGNDGSWDWQTTQNVADSIELSSPNLASEFNDYWDAHGAPSSGSLDVPVKVYLSKAGQLLLTNMQVTGSGSKLRYVQMGGESVDSFHLDFTVQGSGSGNQTIVLDVGDNGTIDWIYDEEGAFPRRLLTGDLHEAVNSYLAGKSGNVTVPLRFHVAPNRDISLYDYDADVSASVDLTAGTPSFATVSAASSPKEGDVIPVSATLRNPSSNASGPLTAAFFAEAPGWGDWYVGSAFVKNLAPGGNVSVSTNWNTTGFYGSVKVKVVVNPYGRTAETSYDNNVATSTIYVQPKQKQAQTITFTKPPAHTLGDPPFSVNAKASSGLPVSISSETPGVCTVSGKTVTLVTTGTCTLTASQAGDGVYAAATSVSQSFVVRSPESAKISQTISFGQLNDRQLKNSTFTLSATASSGLSVSFSSNTTSVCTVSGNKVTLKAVGTCTIVASQAGNNTYAAAPSVTRSFSVINNEQTYLPELHQ